MTLMKFKMNNLSIEEINCIYRCISMSMDWRDAVGEELVKEKCTMDWLTYNIEIALKATNKLAYPDKYND